MSGQTKKKWNEVCDAMDRSRWKVENRFYWCDSNQCRDDKRCVCVNGKHFRCLLTRVVADHGLSNRLVIAATSDVFIDWYKDLDVLVTTVCLHRIACFVISA